MEKWIVNYKIYNLKDISTEDMDKIEKETIKNLEDIKKKGFIENLDWYEDKKCKYWYDLTVWNWYLVENIIAYFDKTMKKKSKENGEKYDFIENWKYIDVKTLILSDENSDFKTIKEKWLKYYIQAKLLDSDLTLKHIKDNNLPMEVWFWQWAKQFCDKNWIDYKDYYVSPCYYNYKKKFLVRLSWEMFRLDNILNNMKIEYTSISKSKFKKELCYFVFKNIYKQNLKQFY